MDGFEALKAIMDTKPVPVIMISSYTKVPRIPYVTWKPGRWTS